MSHAVLSPSSAVRWMTCPGSVSLCKDLPDTPSKFAEEGTAAHELAETCLEAYRNTADYSGKQMSNGYTVDDEMVLAVQDYVDYVRSVVKTTGGILMTEQRLPIDSITGEAGAHGTSDVVILAGDELIVADLKYGRGVAVDAEDNPQLQIYALAALREFSIVQDFTTVRMVIHQPRLGSVSEWVQTVEDLEAFGTQVAIAAAATQAENAALVPTDKGCKFCKAKATCPALIAKIQNEIKLDAAGLTGPTFNPVAAVSGLTDISTAMQMVDAIEGWCKAVRAEVETRLLAGTPVAGFKLVQGKRGNRQWADAEEAEALLKAMRVKHEEMYDYKVISPTSAEKLAKANVIGPRQWPKVQELITQSEGKPSVAPESDKRDALVMAAAASDFEDLTSSSL